MSFLWSSSLCSKLFTSVNCHPTLRIRSVPSFILYYHNFKLMTSLSLRLIGSKWSHSGCWIFSEWTERWWHSSTIVKWNKKYTKCLGNTIGKHFLRTVQVRGWEWGVGRAAMLSGLHSCLLHTWLLPGSLHKYLTRRLCLLAILVSHIRLRPNLMSQWQ